MYIPKDDEATVTPLIFFSLQEDYPFITNYFVSNIWEYKENGKITHRTRDGESRPVMYNSRTHKVMETDNNRGVYDLYAQRLNVAVKDLLVIRHDKLLTDINAHINHPIYNKATKKKLVNLHDDILKSVAKDVLGDATGSVTRRYISSVKVINKITIRSCNTNRYIYIPVGVETFTDDKDLQDLTKKCREVFKRVVPNHPYWISSVYENDNYTNCYADDKAKLIEALSEILDDNLEVISIEMIEKSSTFVVSIMSPEYKGYVISIDGRWE